jgi:hypothetical protein
VKEETEEWSPRMSGDTIAYVPEYRYGAWDEGKRVWTKWKRIPTADGKGIIGVPYPAFEGGMFKTIGMFGYEQAQALAWSFAAGGASEPTKMQVRIAVYRFKYDLKAMRLDGKEVTCEDRS